MASLTLADAASRTAPMSEGKKSKRWVPRKAEPAEAHETTPNEPNESKRTGTLAKPFTSIAAAKGRHNLYKKG